MEKIAEFTFYGLLNDFLNSYQNAITTYSFHGTPTIKDAIEAQGIPHTEIYGIFVNSKPVGFLYKLQPEDKVEVFSHDQLEKQTIYLEQWQKHFVLDVHLGKLARDLRMLGFDCFYDNSFAEDKIIAKATSEKRILLTRSLHLLKNNQITHGYWLRSQHPDEQLREIIKRFDLYNDINPFTRCLICNGEITEVPKEQIENKLPEKTKIYFHQFYQCRKCNRVYWKGSHFEKMEKLVESIRKQ